MINDLATELSLDPSWNPDEVKSNLYNLIESLPTKEEHDDTPFGQAEELFVHLPPSNIAFENYIDDLIIAIGLDSTRNRKCLLHAVPLALHSTFCPVIVNDPIHRDNIINIIKHPAEGLLEEIKTILGWVVNFRSFRVHLPMHKLKDWLIDIDSAIKHASLKITVLESIIGRLNHASYVLPFGKFFLNRLRSRLKKAGSRKYRKVKLETPEIDDLKLWRKLLFNATIKGIDINHITFTVPTITCYSDACKIGLGGYIIGGVGWRYQLPKDLIGIFFHQLAGINCCIPHYPISCHS